MLLGRRYERDKREPVPAFVTCKVGWSTTLRLRKLKSFELDEILLQEKR